MPLAIYQVDSFTSDAFRGNPAGVCITESALNASLMQSIAAEMAVSETAFLALDSMTLRWFTPTVEVDLCGHATLATAHILSQQATLSAGQTLSFNTLSGKLNVKQQDKFIAMDFPLPQLQPTLLPNSAMLQHLGIAAHQIHTCALFDDKLLIVLHDEQYLRQLSPNFDALASLPARAVLVTARAQIHHYDCISRYFAPWIGVNEDPVTGSAHCALAAYWSHTLGKRQLIGYQASTRGGVVHMQMSSSDNTDRVWLLGQAVTVLEGKLLL